MPIVSEPVTLLTDYLLAAVAFWLAARLAAASPRGSSAGALWAVAFAVGAAAALAGGTVHGFRLTLGPFGSALLWQCALLGSALAGTLLVAGAALHCLRGNVLRVALAALAAKAAVELVVISRAGLTRDAVTAGAVAIVLLVALTLLRARPHPAPLAWLVLGLALAGAALAVQAAGLALHPAFNHNDACHVLLTAALWPIYRARPSAEGSGLEWPHAPQFKT